MNLENLTASELEARKAEIATLVDDENADLDALTEEVRAINEELEARKDAEAKKDEIRSLVAEGEGKEIEEIMVKQLREMDQEFKLPTTEQDLNATDYKKRKHTK